MKRLESREPSPMVAILPNCFSAFHSLIWQHFKFEWYFAKKKKIPSFCVFVRYCLSFARVCRNSWKLNIKLSFRVEYDSLFSGNVHFPFGFQPCFFKCDNCISALLSPPLPLLILLSAPIRSSATVISAPNEFQATVAARIKILVFVRSKWMRVRLAEHLQVKFRWHDDFFVQQRQT